ncbi:CRISPR subtype III-B-associated RAMP protein Cmr4 [Thermoanaerobacter kivui]|uniref:CRISPR subtype III-B-associated RAMP protein Cmr4 n=1 Tax=Thermoanaerobacter kivui TaxID=2325 RepID=A0A097AU05_THEKI|nr:RAMP superfamily CRISPR-associated protein [Thermoanaerobacter kivui]AIS53302.1 CRISPR subtype III-B-associated RAMP protein Cmr4 [Thermoanaerobacter kivui]
MCKNDSVKELRVYGMATDPVYIGTGGYTIGRVDNTIVRDPITKLPKIPGSSLAGTWRYYVTLELMPFVKSKIEEHLDQILEFLKNENVITEDEKMALKENKELSKVSFNELKRSIYRILNIHSHGNEDKNKEEKRKKIHEKLKQYFEEKFQINTLTENNENNWRYYEYNKFSRITCAGQDNTPQEELSNAPYATDNEGKTGHCGHCIICKGFGFSKEDLSWQGMIHFSDLNILFFPVFTRLGTKWITTEEILKNAGLYDEKVKGETDKKSNAEEQKFCIALEKIENGQENGHINLGWIYLPYKVENLPIKINDVQFDKFKLDIKKIIIVPENLFSQIVNSNLEVRTSVSIDPITGAAKEGALFTSEAIPRGTIFYGDLRIFNKSAFEGLDKIKALPDYDKLEDALCDSKHFFETLGIGGMTTRGFGRLKLEIKEKKTNYEEDTNKKSVWNNTAGSGGEQE